MNLLEYFNEKTGTIIALLSLIVAVAVGVLQFRPKTRELTCNVLSSTELTSVSQVPGLTSEFVYQQKKVIYLWKLSLNFVNTGNETLVGEGQQSNLLKDSVLFEFPNGTEALNVEVSNSDLPIQVEIRQPNIIALKFSQWRSGEKTNLSIFVTSPNMQGAPLLPRVTTRDIVDGNVIVTNSLNPTPAPKSLIDRMPLWVGIIIKLVLSVLSIFLVWLGLYELPKDLINFIRVKRWKSQNLTEFKSFIDSNEGIPDNKKTIYVADPGSLPDEYWQKFEGNRLKVRNTGGYSSLFKASTITLAIFFIGVLSVIYILSNIFDAYLKVSEFL
jgi:hypothetical protein